MINYTTATAAAVNFCLGQFLRVILG